MSTNTLRTACTVLLLLCAHASALARQVELPLQNNTVVTAEYQPGNPAKPAVLVLHGFLQTRNFFTVKTIFSNLMDEEYTLLTPTLSLGINRRQQSLSCESLHLHNMEGDAQEIGLWLNWLKQQGHRNIVVIGHSFGSVNALYYLRKHHEPAVKKFIAISAVDFNHDVMDASNHSEQKIAEAKSKVARNDTSLGKYPISFCKEYAAPPANYLSYITWSQDEKILTELKKLTIPKEVILGSSDQRMRKGWPERLRKSGAKVEVIEGANHFFDSVHEFDLIDLLTNSLSKP